MKSTRGEPPGTYLYDHAVKLREKQLVKKTSYHEFYQREKLKECSFQPKLNNKSVILAVILNS